MRFYSIVYIFLFFLSAMQLRAQALTEQVIYQSDVGNQVVIKSEKKINTKKYDFSPMWFRDGIVFVSQEKSKDAFNQLYFATIEDDQLVDREEFKLDRDTLLHEGPLTFTKDYKTMYFTRSNIFGGQEIGAENNEVELQIFVADRVGNQWKNIRYLPFNSSEYSTCHPAWDEQNQRLYFSSNRPGGQGGFDLYYIEKKNGKWTDPINLGPEINSASADAFPFYHPYGYLVFASKRKIGSGYDLYLANANKLDEKPVRLPEPFNSNGDDLGLILNGDATKGYFSSDRLKQSSKNRNDDIFSIDAEAPLLFPQRSGIVLDIPVQIVNAETKEPIEGVGVSFYEIPERNLSSEELAALDLENLEYPVEQKQTDSDGLTHPTIDKSSQYLIYVENATFKTYAEVVTFLGTEQAHTIELQRNKICKPISVQFISEDNKLLEVSEVTIKEVCTGNIISVGQTYCPKENCEYEIEARKEHFLPFTTKVNGPRLEEGLTYQLTRKIKSIPPIVTIKEDTKLEKGFVYELSNIYYEYNASGLNEKATQELDRLANIMKKNKQVRIELSSHTDSRGSAAYNLKLSEERAASVRKYLIISGIAADRIVSRGYGETQPRNHCRDGVDCSEMEHQFNRRTELQVIE